MSVVGRMLVLVDKRRRDEQSRAESSCVDERRDQGRRDERRNAEMRRASWLSWTGGMLMFVVVVRLCSRH